MLTPYLLYPLKSITMSCSIFMMMSLAMERYIAVTKPLSRVPSSHSGKLILRYLIPVVFASLLLNLPKFFLFRISFMNSSEVILSITELRTNHYYITYYSWTRWQYTLSSISRDVYSVICRLFMLGLIPLLVVSILNLKIYQAVLHSAQGSVLAGLRRNKTMTEEGMPQKIMLSPRSSTCSKSLSKASPTKKNEFVQFMILLSIIIIFILCSIPRIIILMHEVTIIETIRFIFSFIIKFIISFIYLGAAFHPTGLVQGFPCGTWSWGK